eukprot:8661595-Ditylum_brightwellii.AAC.1
MIDQVPDFHSLAGLLIFLEGWTVLHQMVNGKAPGPKGTLAPVPKQGDLLTPNKWRPKYLLETSSNILASIIVHRINSVIKDHGLEAHFGSLDSKSCNNANYSPKSALQICRVPNLTTHVLFYRSLQAMGITYTTSGFTRAATLRPCYLICFQAALH